MSTASLSRRQILLPNKANAFLWVSALCMLFGLLVLHWSPASVLTAYFFETIIIGLIHVVKMLTVLFWSKAQKAIPPNKKTNENHGGSILFFIAHYFFFVFVQSVFMFLLLQGEVSGVKDSFQVWNNYAVLLQQSDTQQAVALIFFTNIVIALRQFFIPGKYHVYTLAGMFMQPYVRIIIQQFVVIVSGFFMFMNGAIVAAILLIATRLVIDLYLFAAASKKETKEALLNALTNKQDDKTKAKTKDMLRGMLDD